MAEHRPQPADPDFRDVQRLVEDARRAGVNDFQVLAVVRPSTAPQYVLLVDDRDDDVWAVPVAWVHPMETVPLTLDWLCDRHLGLVCWSAAFATTLGYRTPEDTDVLQLAFDVTVPLDSALSWPGRCRWWDVRTEPPTLHRLSQPLLRRLRHPGRG
jgi:hypothetical protein